VRHGPRAQSVFGYTVPIVRFFSVSTSAAIVGLIAITIYLVLERALADHLPVVLCLRELLQWDASNAYGVRAFDGGWSVAVIGLAMDFVVSFVWAVVFTILYVKLPFLRRDVVLSGLCFGVVVMVVMIYGIVPLGHAMQMQRTLWHVANVLIAHSVFFGLPVALTVSALATAATPRRLSPRDVT
jgi:hypothetical protein